MREASPRLQSHRKAKSTVIRVCRRALPTSCGLCYNHPAVGTPMNVRTVPNDSGPSEQRQTVEHPISFCPVCSQRLEPKRCKLVCRECGYYLACSDYY